MLISCTKSKCNCSECLEQFKDHSRYQRVWYWHQNQLLMKASHFLFSCQECDHNLKTTEQVREHVHKINLVTKRLYHKYHHSNEDDDDFICDICVEFFWNKSELVKHVMKEHYQNQEMNACDKCGKYSFLRAYQCVHKSVLEMLIVEKTFIGMAF